MNDMVFIMSGIPGSGKTYIARHLANAFEFKDAPGMGHRSYIFSADDYFVKLGRFDGSKIGLAHQSCFRRFMDVVGKPRFGNRTNVVFVDNTNLRSWEAAPYILAAETYGYKWQMLRINASLMLCRNRQIHNVPRGTMETMTIQFEMKDIAFHWAPNIIDIFVDSTGNIVNSGDLPIPGVL